MKIYHVRAQIIYTYWEEENGPEIVTITRGNVSKEYVVIAGDKFKVFGEVYVTEDGISNEKENTNETS